MSWNQLFSNFFSKKRWFDGKNVDISKKFPQCDIAHLLFWQSVRKIGDFIYFWNFSWKQVESFMFAKCTGGYDVYPKHGTTKFLAKIPWNWIMSWKVFFLCFENWFHEIFLTLSLYTTLWKITLICFHGFLRKKFIRS